jgi:dihydroflavonol-4-reductase
MKILVTGGTGFVGAHVVAAAARAGHDVRLLVRRPEQVSTSLGPLGVEVADIVLSLPSRSRRYVVPGHSATS